MQQPTWTVTSSGTRETTWHGEIFHLSQEGALWYLHRGPETLALHSNAALALDGGWATITAATDRAGLLLNGWTENPNRAFTYLDDTTRDAENLLTEFRNALKHTPTRGEDCLDRARLAHLAECSATRISDICPVHIALDEARRTALKSLMEKVVDSHPDVRWFEPAKAGAVVVHFAARDNPRIRGGIGYDLDHAGREHPWHVGVEERPFVGTGPRVRATVPTAAQLADEITRQVSRVRAVIGTPR
ncbi:hypothetical protein [Nocardiopsis synnemataformans]|uniref:hypothetical protein n=1 Tax=Nocardiopsis synnemataformans TaxID=61305 RepID=UPI003EC08AD7